MTTGRTRTTAGVASLLVAVLGLAGCANQPRMHDGDAGDAWGGGLVDRSAGMMSGRPMASSEHDFLVTMVAHHREAIVAAGQLARSGRPELRAFGRRIIQAQADQVRQMRGWLDRWYWPGPVPGSHHPMMSDLTSLNGD